MTVTFNPVDAKGRAVSGLDVVFTSTDAAAVLAPSGYQVVVRSTSSPSNYFMSVNMTNYSVWQPDDSPYNLIPESGVLLATLKITPILCASTKHHDPNAFVCTPTSRTDYIGSGLGFEIEVISRNDLWDENIELTSSTVNGEVKIQALNSIAGANNEQNCSVPVSTQASWMNDYGESVNGIPYTLALQFSSDKKIINTVTEIGYKLPGNGGGIGLCDLTIPTTPLKNMLIGIGSVEFTARTASPSSINKFSVSVGNKRMDSGKATPVFAYIYTGQNN